MYIRIGKKHRKPYNRNISSHLYLKLMKYSVLAIACLRIVQTQVLCKHLSSLELLQTRILIFEYSRP